MLRRASARGMTLIELMIGIAITALLLAFGLPSFSAWMANSRVRGTAESLQSGLAVARAEAIRRNQNVEFVLTNDGIDLGSIGTVVPAGNGIHWLVRAINPANGQYDLIDSRSGQEGSGRADSASSVQVAASAPIVAFQGVGGTNVGATATYDFSNPGAGACHTTATPSPIRCLRVQVSVSGQIRLCDPATTGSDTRAC